MNTPEYHFENQVTGTFINSPVTQMNIGILEAPPTLPHELGPVGAYQFVDRDPSLKWLNKSSDMRSGAGALLFISGIPGVGKSALVKKWAYEMVQGSHFCDGQLYINFADSRLGGSSDIADIMRQKLTRYWNREITGGAICASDLHDIYLQRTYEKNILVILDDVSSDKEIESFIPDSSQATTIVMSTRGFVPSGKWSAQEYALEPLSTAKSMELFCRLLYSKKKAPLAKTDPELKDIEAIVSFCEGVPLAITVCACMLKNKKGLSPKRLLEKLSNASFFTEKDFKEFYSVWDACLDQLSPQARRALLLFGCLPYPLATVATLAATWGVDEDTTKEIVDELSSFRLVELSQLSSAGRISLATQVSLYSLLRSYARNKAHELLEANEEFKLQERLFCHFRMLAQAIDFSLGPRLRRYEETLIDSLCQNYLSLKTPFEIFETEKGYFQYLAEISPDPRFDEDLWSMGEALWPFYHNSGYAQVAAQVFDRCSAAAKRCGNVKAQAHLESLAGRTRLDLNEIPKAQHLAQHAYALGKTINDEFLQASLEEFNGVLLSRLGQHEDAIAEFEKARVAFSKHNRKRGLAIQDYLIGKELLSLKRYEDCEARLLRSSNLIDAQADKYTLTKPLSALANLYNETRRYDKAIESAQKCARIATELKKQRLTASSYYSLAYAYQGIGDHDLALKYAKPALTYYQNSGDQEKAAKLQSLLAEL